MVSATFESPAAILAAFAVAAVFLERFGRMLPRRLSVSMSGPVIAASIAILSPAEAGVVAVLAVFAAGFRKGRSGGVSVLARLAGFVVALVGGTLASGSLGPTVGQAMVATLYLVVEYALGSLDLGGHSRHSFAVRSEGRPVALSLLAAQIACAVLVVITYEGMRIWSLIPAVTLVMLSLQSYSLLTEVGDTYWSTVQLLVEVAEGANSARRGHARRVAESARRIASHLRLPESEIERIGYAALLHDVDAVGREEGRAECAMAEKHSAAVLQGVGFFESVTPILKLCDAVVGGGSDSAEDTRAALIVALASDSDEVIHPQVHEWGGSGLLEGVASNVERDTMAAVVGAAIHLNMPTPAVK